MIARKIVMLLAAWCLVPLALWAQTDDETWAQLVLDHPLDRAGDADRVVASWVDMIVDEPEHALVDGTLALLRDRLDALQDPSALPGHMDALAGVRDLMTPAAQRRFELLSAEVTTRFAPAEQLGADLYPDFVAHWWVLGPLHPVADPRFAGREPLLTADPDEVLVVRGPEGDVRGWLTFTPDVEAPTVAVMEPRGLGGVKRPSLRRGASLARQASRCAGVGA